MELITGLLVVVCLTLTFAGHGWALYVLAAMGLIWAMGRAARAGSRQ